MNRHRIPAGTFTLKAVCYCLTCQIIMEGGEGGDGERPATDAIVRLTSNRQEVPMVTKPQVTLGTRQTVLTVGEKKQYTYHLIPSEEGGWDKVTNSCALQNKPRDRKQ